MWAARYNTWLLIKLTPKGVVLSFLFSPAECGHARHVLPNGDGSWEVVMDHGVHQHQVHHSLHIGSHAKVLIVVACI